MKTEIKLKEPYILKIWQDIDAESPNDWGSEDVFLVYDHRSFTIERDGFEPIEIHNYLTIGIDYKNEIIDYFKYWVFIVYAYIHSGVSLSLDNTDYPHNCKWDTSSTGYILVKKDILQQGAGNIEKDLTKEEATKYAESLIKEWNIYLNNEVYGFTVIEKINKVKQLTTLISEEFDKTRYLSKLGKAFTKAMVKDILIKNLGNCTIEEKDIDSCGGFYKKTDVQLLADMLNNIDSNYYPTTPHTDIKLIAQSLLN